MKLSSLYAVQSLRVGSKPGIFSNTIACSGAVAVRAAALALLLGAAACGQQQASYPAASPPPAQTATAPTPAQRLFASGFEGTTTIVPPLQTNIWGTGGWSDITGTDSTTGFTWPPNIWGGGGGRFLFLTDPLVVSAANVGSYMFNRIETVTGPKGNPTQALYQEISRNVNGTEPMGTSPTTNLFMITPNGETSDLYVSYWVKLQPDLAEKMNNLPAGPGIIDGGTWRAFFAFKTGTQKPLVGLLNDPMDNGDYRIEVYVMTYGGGTPYWQVLADNNAGGGAPLVNNWSVQNRAVPVPVGEWFKFEFFLHRSNAADGRVRVAVNGNVIADQMGPNMGAWNLPINRISMPTVYTGSRMPVYQWIDDLEIWNGIPPVGAPAPAVALSAAPASIAAGQSTTLSWSSTDAASCAASGGWSGAKALSGSEVATPSANATYTLSCTGAGGSTAKSATVTVTTPSGDTQPPSVPAGLVGTALSSTQIKLSWNPSTDNVGVVGYYVYLNDVALATTTSTSFTHSGLTAGVTYNYRVSAYDAVPNHSAWTATQLSLTTLLPALDTQAPSVPTGLSGAAVSSSQIELAWNPSSDNVGVTGYYVYLNDVALTTTTATSFTHSGLAAGITYNYRVSAYDAVPNHSAWTAAPVSVTTQPAPPAPDTQAPSVPAGLMGTAPSSTQIKLSWSPSTDNVGVTGYYVYLNDVALATTTATSFTHSGLTAGTTYNYRVSAYDAVPNHSAWTATPVSVKTPLRRAVRGDVNGDGKSDILWRNGVTGENAIWLMSGAAAPANTPIDAVSDLNWGIAGFADFNADGKSDILWRNRATGQNGFFLMNGATVSGIVFIDTIADLNWTVSGVGDFNGDGKLDILWRNGATGENFFFLMNGTAVSGTVFLDSVADLKWNIAGVGDFDGDGKADILWRHGVTGEFSIWFMNGAAISSRSVFGAVTDLNWVIAGVGDFDGDGKSDILWHNNATGSNTIWLISGTAITGGATNFAAVSDVNWGIAGVGDYDGDGKSDILWRNGATGENAVWLMNGAAIVGQSVLPRAADLNWGTAGGR